MFHLTWAHPKVHQTSMKGFSIPEVLVWYAESLGLKNETIYILGSEEQEKIEW